jgi:hypothetical protein
MDIGHIRINALTDVRGMPVALRVFAQKAPCLSTARAAQAAMMFNSWFSRSKSCQTMNHLIPSSGPISVAKKLSTGT